MEKIKVSEDGKVTKVILEKGTEDTMPAANQQVFVTYIGKLMDGTQFDSNVDKENPFKFKLGAGEVIKGWDLGVATMKKGEKALFEIHPDYAYGKSGSPPKIPADATLQFEVQLLDFKDKEKDKWELTTKERLDKGKLKKDEGNASFKSKNYQEAIKLYEQAEDVLDVYEDEKNEESKQLRVVVFNNMAQCYLNLNNNAKVLEVCDKALKIDTTNSKANFRKAVAYTNLQEFDKAKSDLAKVQEKEPNNPDVQHQLNVIKAKIQEINKKDKKVWGQLFKQSYYEEQAEATSSLNNPIVYFDVKIGDQQPERIEFELFQNIVPKTVSNFVGLATGDKKYKNTIFHRLIKNFMIQGGDYENRNGTGGKSIYGNNFADENFKVNHTKRGQLSMANAGPNTNGSQFFITLKETPHLNGKHVVFGEVVKNIELLDKLEQVETENDKPVKDIVVVDCGLVEKQQQPKPEEAKQENKPEEGKKDDKPQQIDVEKKTN